MDTIKTILGFITAMGGILTLVWEGPAQAKLISLAIGIPAIIASVALLSRTETWKKTDGRA